MSKFLYQLFISFYPIAIKLVAPFNQKARLWVKGRRGVFQRLSTAIKPGEKIIWMHCASLGEFEQGRPVLERLQSDYPTYKILLTFFSPSGYEVRKNYDKAHIVSYLPMDSRKNAVAFFSIVKPALVLFVKYEYWYYYLNEARYNHTPLLLISALFRQDQPFFNKLTGGVYRRMLHCFSAIFVQNKQSLQLLSQIGHAHHAAVAGDTRFDRVAQIASNIEPLPIIEGFVQQYPVIVAGSTWLEDDKELCHFANANTQYKFIIAPHSIQPSRIRECLQYYNNAVLYSQLAANLTVSTTANILIIDNIGMLSRLYSYATVAYIGGAFGSDGVHNVLEAAVYGRPVVFGPVYSKYYEACELIATEGATSISTPLELEAVLHQLLSNKTIWQKQATAARQYVNDNRGATDTIMQYIYEKRLLIN